MRWSTAGLAVATIDYRLVREAAFPAQLHDVKAAGPLPACARRISWVWTPGRMGVWGESAGGHLASLVGLTAHRPDLDGNLGSGRAVQRGGRRGRLVRADRSRDDARDRTGPSPLADILPEGVASPEDQLLDGLDERTRSGRQPDQSRHGRRAAVPDRPRHAPTPWCRTAQSEQLAAALTAAGVPARLVPVDGAEHIFLGCTDIGAVVRLSRRVPRRRPSGDPHMSDPTWSDPLRPARPRGRRRPAERRREGVRASVRALCDSIAPGRAALVRDRGAGRPARAGEAVRRAGAAGDAPRRLRLRRDERGRLRPRLPGAGGLRLGHPQPGVGAGVAGDVRDPRLRQRGAEAAVAAADGRRRRDRLLRADRARPRLGPGVDDDPRPSRRGRLGARRPQDVDHQRLDRRRRGRVGPGHGR